MTASHEFSEEEEVRSKLQPSI